MAASLELILIFLFITSKNCQHVTEKTSQLENNTRVKGFYDVTPLAKFPWFDLVLGIVPDYMHGVLLGNTREDAAVCFAIYFGVTHQSSLCHAT